MLLQKEVEYFIRQPDPHALQANHGNMSQIEEVSF
jgi:hypothetical protein